MRSKVLSALRSRIRAGLYLFTFNLILISGVTTLFADTWQTEPFLESVKETSFDFRYLREGLNSINGVRFGNDVINQYQQFFNQMTLSSSMGDGARRIKPLKSLSNSDFGTLFHESFHAFKANHMDQESAYINLSRWFVKRADIVFGDLSQSKRQAALEEAYASFIGLIAETRLTFTRLMHRPSEQDCELRLTYMRRLWAVGWAQEIKGYYYKDGIGEYWAHQLEGLWTLVTEGRKAYGEFRNQDGAILVSEALPQLDKSWISENIFENQITEDFDKTFETDIKAIGCLESVTQH
jgi:hypothetical protein